MYISGHELVFTL